MNICIIAGQGNLPKSLAVNYKNRFVICIKDLCQIDDFDDPKTEITIFEFEKIIDLLKKNNIKKIIFAGKFYRPNDSNVKIDKTTKILLNNVYQNGDNNVLMRIKTFFEHQGFEILPPTYIYKKNLFKNYKIFSNNQKKLKIEFVIKSTEYGFNLLNEISKFDVGQAAVVYENHVIGIEGLEGTNALIERCGVLFKNKLQNNNSLTGPVLVKFPKRNQSLAIDMPVIGIETIRLCYKHNFAGVSVSKSGTLILDQEKIIDFCRSNDFIFYPVGDLNP